MSYGHICARAGGAVMHLAKIDADVAWRLIAMQRDMDKIAGGRATHVRFDRRAAMALARKKGYKK